LSKSLCGIFINVEISCFKSCWNFALHYLFIYFRLSTLNALKCYTHLLVSIPPVGCAGDPVCELPSWILCLILLECSLNKKCLILCYWFLVIVKMLQHEELLRSTLLDGNLQWLCYLSSTSTYFGIRIHKCMYGWKSNACLCSFTCIYMWIYIPALNILRTLSSIFFYRSSVVGERKFGFASNYVFSQCYGGYENNLCFWSLYRIRAGK
jgi:hypothetical protein